jgi:hypothetical protein
MAFAKNGSDVLDFNKIIRFWTICVSLLFKVNLLQTRIKADLTQVNIFTLGALEADSPNWFCSTHVAFVILVKYIFLGGILYHIELAY